MKIVLLAGGIGSRLQEETIVKPKPMVEIGGRPILWHIMKSYARYGFKEFVIALGYKGEYIKNYFLDYYHLRSNMSIDLGNGKVTVADGEREDWIVHLVDTGDSTETGGRIKKLAPWIKDDTFLMTYGDGVSDVNLKDLLAVHKKNKKIATVTAVRPPARFGGLKFEKELATEFLEKPQIGEGWINGGYFVLEPAILKYIQDDHTIFEREPLEKLVKENQLAVHRHDGFWQCMDTLRDVRLLQSMWDSGKAPWMD